MQYFFRLIMLTLFCSMQPAQAFEVIPCSLKKTTAVLQSQSLPSKASKADRCLMGVYPVHLYDFDLAKNTFKVSFYAWWRTSNKSYAPEKSVEIVNATEYYSKFGTRGQNGDEFFTYVHYYATILHPWNMRYFPFDRQFLEVRLEDFADINAVVLTPDRDQSFIHPELRLDGWDVIGMQLKDSVTRYLTNFGDKSTEKGLYSRITFQIEIKRQGWRTYFNNFIGFFVAMFLSLMIYFVHPNDLSSRANLSLGGIVTSVGNKYVIDQRLPITAEFTLADTIQIATFLMISVTILNFIVLKRFEERLTIQQISKLNYAIGILAALIYVVWVGAHTYIAVWS